MQIMIPNAGAINDRFKVFSLDGPSYYPTKKIIERIMMIIYQVGYKEGLFASEKYRAESGAVRLSLDVPLMSCDVDGEFILFIPEEDEPAWGLMNIRRVFSRRRPDINLSIISPMVLMPHRLHVLSGGIYEHKSQFCVIDEDGSNWTLHCK